jgi:hypothetical protein
VPEIPLSYFALAYAPWVLMLSGAFYLGLRLVRAFERRSSARAEIAALEERLLRLEEGASTISDRVERLAEGHEFTARLLTDRK